MNPPNPLANQLIRATLAQFEADRETALATISLFLNVPAGVGEHPNIVKELQEATLQLATAEEALDALHRNFLTNSSAEEGTPNE